MEGAALIQQERLRQVMSEGWDAEHDDAHANGQLRHAAICYAHNAGRTDGRMSGQWPWDAEWWKPTGNEIRDLVKAGALIAAEIDRLQRDIENNAEDEPLAISVTAGLLVSRGLWDEACRLKGIMLFALKEGLMQKSDMVHFTESEASRLGLVR